MGNPQHKVGTRIRFTKTIDDGPLCDHAPRLHALVGQLGTITGHGTKEGYWVKADGNDNAFGVGSKEFEVIQ